MILTSNVMTHVAVPKCIRDRLGDASHTWFQAAECELLTWCCVLCLQYGQRKTSGNDAAPPLPLPSLASWLSAVQLAKQNSADLPLLPLPWLIGARIDLTIYLFLFLLVQNRKDWIRQWKRKHSSIYSFWRKTENTDSASEKRKNQGWHEKFPNARESNSLPVYVAFLYFIYLFIFPFLGLRQDRQWRWQWPFHSAFLHKPWRNKQSENSCFREQ